MRVVDNLEENIKQIYGEKFEQLDFKFSVISKSFPFFVSVVYKANCLSEIIALCRAVLDEEYLSPEEVKKLIRDAIVAHHSQLIDLAVDVEHEMNEIYYTQILPDLVEAGFLTRFSVPTLVWEEDENE